MSVWTQVFHEVDNTSSGPVRSNGDDTAGSTSMKIQLRRNGTQLDSRSVVASGSIGPFHRRPVPDNLTLTVSSNDGTITFVSPTSIVVGAPGGGSVGTVDGDGGYRHSSRVCPLSADTIISNCSGFAYKFNNTRVQGTITQGGGGAGGETVKLERCRTPQSLNAQQCAAKDGFSRTDTTSGSGAYDFSGLLEGIYQVSAGGVSRLVATKGKGNVQVKDFTIP